MSISKYCLNWDAYKNNICNGFAKLQQSEEFVDMTLVADGHLVRVHKNLLALASPYIKQIISKTSCEHPVIFFSNISHEILCYIVEYIYTGQVQVEVEMLQLFLKAAKELALPMIENTALPIDKIIESNNHIQVEPVVINANVPTQAQGYQHVDLSLTNNVNENGDIIIPLDHNYTIDNIDVNGIDDLIQFNNTPNTVITPNEIKNNFGTMAQEINIINTENHNTNTDPVQLKIDTQGSKPQQYTVSNRGSLQLILNRYIYSNHHQALRGHKRRWRCIDYRLLRCKAFIDTMGETINKRMNMHNHPFHDSKIMKKIRANLIFGSINNALDKSKELNSLHKTERMEESD